MAPYNSSEEIPLEAVVTHSTAGGRRHGGTSPGGLDHQPTFKEKTPTEKSGLFHRHAGKRRLAKLDSKGQPVPSESDDEEETRVTRMGKIYSKILNFSIVTRYFLYVLPLALCIAVPIIVGATAAKKASLGGVRIVWLFTWVEIVWLSLWVSKLFAHFLPSVFQAAMGVVSAGTRKYALVIKALQTPLTLALWALASLATFMPLMLRNPDTLGATKKAKAASEFKNWQRIVNNLLGAAMVSSLIFLAERVIIQLISINYHRKQFNTKIKESKRNIYLLSLLYDASRTLFPAYCNEFVEEDYIIADSIALAVGGKKTAGHNRSGSATPLKLMQDVGRFGDKITAAFGSVAHELTGKKVFNPDSAHSVVVEALEKKRSSEALAKRIWMSFVVEGKDSLFQDDIMEVLGANRQKEAEECFAALDRDGNGDISLDEMILTVSEVGRERKSIASSMHDVDQAINVLDRLPCTVVFVICVFVLVGFMNANFVTTLATAGTALLSLSFVFAATAQEVLGSCIFLFVKHPYDIGDRVDISDEDLIVEHISLLFTGSRRVTNGKTVQIPNIVLNGLWIENITRSKAMREQLSVYISFDTSFEDIQALKAELQNFVLEEDNSRDFLPEIDVEVIGIAEMNKMELKVNVMHKSNWHNEAVRAARRSKFMCALVLALRKIPIYGPGGGDAALGSESKPTYSVSVTDEQASAVRDHFTAQKAAKRFVPTSKASEAAHRDHSVRLSGYKENKAVNELTARSPSADFGRDDAWASNDNSTLGRASMEHRDADEAARSLLHREGTVSGRRRAGSIAPPTVPTIAEPHPARMSSISYNDYAHHGPTPAYQDSYASPLQAQTQHSPRSPDAGNAFAQQQQRRQEEQRDLNSWMP